MNNEEQKSNKKGGYILQNLKVRKKAVEEYLSGDIPVPELVRKYDIATSTLYNWLKEMKAETSKRMRKYPKELKLRIVKEIVTGVLREQEASAQYQIKKTTIHGWCTRYSSQISASTIKPMASKKQIEESRDDNDRVRKLEKALEDANLKIIGLETMINIAEKDLKIDIRKKSGTKQ